MTNALKYKEAAKLALTQEGVECEEDEELGPTSLVTFWTLENLDDHDPVMVVVDFSLNPDGVLMFCNLHLGVPRDDAAVLNLINEVNLMAPMVKFMVHPHDTLMVSIGSRLNPDAVGDDCVELLAELLAVVDSVYPALASVMDVVTEA